MSKNSVKNSVLFDVWNLVSKEQKIAYLDAAASNYLPLAIASIALNDPDDEVATAALVSVVDCADPKDFKNITEQWLLHDSWRVREAAMRVCEKLQQFPNEKLVIQLFVEYPEDAARLCEDLDAWQQMMKFCFAYIGPDVWDACHRTYERDVLKIECVKKVATYYDAYCSLYEFWARYRPDEATQSAEEKAACGLFVAWRERYADKLR